VLGNFGPVLAEEAESLQELVVLFVRPLAGPSIFSISFFFSLLLEPLPVLSEVLALELVNVVMGRSQEFLGINFSFVVFNANVILLLFPCLLPLRSIGLACLPVEISVVVQGVVV